MAEVVQAGRRCGRKRVWGGWEPGGSATRGIGVTGRGDLTRTGYDSLRICAPVTETLIQLCKFLPSPTSPPSHAPHESPPPPSTPPPPPPPSLTLGGCPDGRPWRSGQSVEYVPAGQPGLGALVGRIRSECDDDERRGRWSVVQSPPGRVNNCLPCRSTTLAGHPMMAWSSKARSVPHLYGMRLPSGQRGGGRRGGKDR